MGERQRKCDLAERRVVRVAERTIRVQAPVRYRRDGSLVGRVTDGRWERTFYGVTRNVVSHFDAGARRHIDNDIYRIGLDGQGLTRLSRTDGTHRAIFNPSFTRYVGVWSDAATPAQVRLHSADGAEIRVIDANAVLPSHSTVCQSRNS